MGLVFKSKLIRSAHELHFFDGLAGNKDHGFLSALAAAHLRPATRLPLILGRTQDFIIVFVNNDLSFGFERCGRA